MMAAATSGLHGIFGWNQTLVAVAVALVATVLAIYGYDWLHRHTLARPRRRGTGPRSQRDCTRRDRIRPMT
ncbi:hypothetical protein [Spirillospora sp. CA-128828]|uniref:hypothetical protein n=1 Tax=Spirillospora sp. CA-128828 TaxID=3240033 RepID=UPI003D8A3B18